MKQGRVRIDIQLARKWIYVKIRRNTIVFQRICGPPCTIILVLRIQLSCSKLSATTPSFPHMSEHLRLFSHRFILASLVSPPSSVKAKLRTLLMLSTTLQSATTHNFCHSCLRVRALFQQWQSCGKRHLKLIPKVQSHTHAVKEVHCKLHACLRGHVHKTSAKFSGFLTPPPPFIYILCTVRLQNWPIFRPPLPPHCRRLMYIVPKIMSALYVALHIQQ